MCVSIGARYNRVMTSEKSPAERRPVRILQIEEILLRVDAMPELDRRSTDEILGYDEHGLAG